MREVVGDTETTGRAHQRGDRVIQIGFIELWNGVPTGATLTSYINPEGRKNEPEAYKVHGIRDAFLIDKPTFREMAPKIGAFLRDDPFVAHNATFDVGFLNAEFALAGYPQFQIGPARVVDTLKLARAKHPGGPNGLAALAARYKVVSERFHDALADADVLAQLYVLLKSGPQGLLDLAPATAPVHRPINREPERHDCYPAGHFPSRAHLINRDAHAAFVATLGNKDTPSIWAEYLGNDDGKEGAQGKRPRRKRGERRPD